MKRSGFNWAAKLHYRTRASALGLARRLGFEKDLLRLVDSLRRLPKAAPTSSERRADSAPAGTIATLDSQPTVEGRAQAEARREPSAEERRVAAKAAKAHLAAERKRATKAVARAIRANEEVLAERAQNAAAAANSPAALREAQELHRRLLEDFRDTQSHRYGSHTPGRVDWQERWDASPGRRVLLYALSDYSGSFFKWADAINRHTDFAARLVVFYIHKYGYGEDIVMPFPDPDHGTRLDELVAEADIVHIKDESGFFDGSNRLPPELLTKHGKPMIFSAYGGFMRKLESDAGFRRYVDGFDARISMTPDLIYDWFDAKFIPHAIDSESWGYDWTDGRLLAHSPSTKERKGTADLVAAIEGLNLDFDLIHGVSHEECIRRKRLASLFFDQAGTEMESKLGINTVIGWYGNSAIEAAVFGIPTIAHLSEHAFAGARRAGRDIEEACAIINTPRGVEGIRRTVGGFFDLPPDRRLDLSLKTRAWVEDFHSYKACARELARVYKELVPTERG